MVYKSKFESFLESVSFYDRTLVEGIREAYGLLFEGLTEENRVKYYPDVPVEEFNKYISADPTNGTYQKWILNLRKKGLKEEDLYKVTDYLKIFDKYKAKLAIKDINQIKSLPELYTVIEPIKIKLDQGDKSIESTNEQTRITKSGAKTIYEDSRWLITAPTTKEYACYYGKGTQWCTASESSDNMFDTYNKQGQLYIIIDKEHKGQGGKWQFHKKTKSFMDSTDYQINSINMFPEPVIYKIIELYGIDNTAKLLIRDINNLSKYHDLFKEYFKDARCIVDVPESHRIRVINEFHDSFYEGFTLHPSAIRFIPDAQQMSVINEFHDSFSEGFKYNASYIKFVSPDIRGNVIIELKSTFGKEFNRDPYIIEYVPHDQLMSVINALHDSFDDLFKKHIGYIRFIPSDMRLNVINQFKYTFSEGFKRYPSAIKFIPEEQIVNVKHLLGLE